MAIAIFAPLAIAKEKNEATLYKWTNEQGSVVYSATLPKEAIAKGRQVINTQTGEVIRTIDKPLNPEEREILAKEKEEATLNLQASEDFAESQFMLIKMYPDKRSIQEVYKQKYSMIDSQLKRQKAEQKQLMPSIESNLRIAGDQELKKGSESVDAQLEKTILDLGKRWTNYNKAIQDTLKRRENIKKEQEYLEIKWSIAESFTNQKITLKQAKTQTDQLLEKTAAK